MKMMKRTLCLVLALVMLVGMFTVGASAQTTDRDKVKVTLNYVASSDDIGRAQPYTTNTLYLSLGDNIVGTANKIGLPAGFEETSDTAWYWLVTGNKIPSTRNIGYVKNSDTELEKDFTICKVVKKIEPTTYTIKFDKNSDNATGEMTSQTANVNEDTVLKAEEFDWDGYRFIGWCIASDGNGIIYNDKATINSLANGGGEITLYAQWEAVSPVIPSDPTSDVPSSLLKTFPNAVKITCLKDHHEDAYYPLEIKSADQVTMLSDKKAMVELSSSDISAYIADYNDDVDGKHAYNVNARSTVAVVLEYKQGFYCFPGHWEVTAIAELPVTCDCMHCHDYCGGFWHKHTVTYTDGVKNATVFKDITYEVKHGAKTPVPADPVRAGYKFAGWTPAVSAKTTKCVTYTATWTAVKAPALTTKHVAYLKGYGGGIVKPEGEITRAEAITMLYRLMDAASVKEYYTSYNAFTDVAKDAWYNDAVSTLANAGVLRYKTGLLNPNEKITRAEFFYMLTKFSNATYTGKATFVDVPVSYWAYEELALAQYLGWIKGYGGGILYPDDTITRAEVAASLNRVLGRTDCKTKDTKNYSDNPVNAWYYQDIVEASIAH